VSRFWLASQTLWQREMVRFYRQPSRVVGALGSPVIFWLLIGSGIGRSFKSESAVGADSYLQYFFPGTILLILLFTAIFSTISLIEDRREGFLQSVLIAPVSRASIVFGKILGGTTLALTQAALFLIIAPWIGIQLSLAGWLWLAVVLFISAFSLTGLGFLIAWQFQSIQGFHAVMNLFLIPLWLLSGALFPAEGAAGWIQAVMKWNPLSYEMNLLRSALFDAGAATQTTSLIVTLGFGLGLFILTSFMVSKRSATDFK